MTQTKTRKALLMSVLSMVLCVAMLVGMTFAWFTDTASTAVNKIQAGNLKMEVTYKNSDTTAFTKVVKDTNVFKTDTLWEPGHVEYAVLNVKNVGTLALKYKLGINIASETGSTNVLGNKFNLSDYIKFAIVEGDQSNLDRTALVAEAGEGTALKAGYSKESTLKATQDTAEPTLASDETVTLVVWMPDSVGNEANYAVGKKAPIIKLGINVVATQLNRENDSYGNTYDENAPYPVAVSTERELLNALENGESVVLKDDVYVQYGVSVPGGKDVTIDLNGKTVTAKKNFVTIKDDAKLTVSGGTVNAGIYVFNVDGGEVIVNGGNYTAQECVFAVEAAGKMTVNSGTFTSKDNSVISTNGNIENAGSEIIINGGIFNANIQTNGYIACGVYVANKDTVKINAGTFNVKNGIGVMMRAGNTTIGKDVVINMTSDGTVTAGKVADAAIQINAGDYLVSDTKSGYPGLDDTFNITNNSKYSLVEYK